MGGGSTGGLQVTAYRDIASMEPIADEWDELVFHTSPRPAMLSHAWVSSYLQYRHPEKVPWFCLAARDGGRLVGVLPLVVREREVWGRRSTVLAPPADPHLISVDMAAAPGYEAAAAGAFCRMLDEIAPGWFGVQMAHLDSLSALAGTSLRIPGAVIVRTGSGAASVVDTTGDWAAYRESLSHNFRRQLKKSMKKLGECADVGTEFHSGAGARPEMLDRFMPVEQAGWKGKGGSAIGAERGLTRFYQALTERLARRRVLEWHFLAADGRTIAGHMAMRSGQTLLIWKIGYDEAYAQCSPGVLLMEQTLARAFADEATDAVDFVTDRAWHQAWRPQRRPYTDVWIFPRRPKSLLAGAWPVQARARLRRIPWLVAAVNRARKIRGGGTPEQAE